jgi:hypothetical protein
LAHQLFWLDFKSKMHQIGAAVVAKIRVGLGGSGSGSDIKADQGEMDMLCCLPKTIYTLCFVAV